MWVDVHTEEVQISNAVLQTYRLEGDAVSAIVTTVERYYCEGTGLSHVKLHAYAV
jgi:hypothetical protein